MTSMIPESIIQKIMLYISHPTADILKASVEFKKIRKRTDRNNNSTYYIKCIDCDKNIEWLRKKYLCFECRQLELDELDELREESYTEIYYDTDNLHTYLSYLN